MLSSRNRSPSFACSMCWAIIYRVITVPNPCFHEAVIEPLPTKPNFLSLCTIQNMSIPLPMEFKSLFLSLINLHDRLHHFETLCHYFVHEVYIMYIILFNWLSMQVWILARIRRSNYFSFRSVKLQRLST